MEHQEIIHCTLSNGLCHAGLQTAFEQDQGGSSILVLLESCLQTCMTYTITECTMNKLLMMDRGTVQKHVEFHAKINL